MPVKPFRKKLQKFFVRHGRLGTAAEESTDGCPSHSADTPPPAAAPGMSSPEQEDDPTFLDTPALDAELSVLPSSVQGGDSETGAETPTVAQHGARAADATRTSVADGCLWDRAYSALQKDKDKADRIAKYEALLSRVIIKAPSSPHRETEDTQETPNEFIDDDATARREKLKRITELGLQHMEDKKISVTLLGHELVLQDQVTNVAVAVSKAQDYIKDAISGLPYASIVCAGVALVLPLLKNATAVEAANQEGFLYVTSQMRYYAAMESLLLPKDLNLDLKEDLEERLMDLYKLIIDFQIQSILRFYRSRTKNFFRGTINCDGWDKMLQDIKTNEAALVQKFETAMSGASLDVATNSLRELKKLAQEAEASRRVQEENLGLIVKELLEMRRIQQQQLLAQMSEKDNECLRYIRLTNPRDEMARIEQTKGHLLEGCYKWILDHPDFRRWRNEEQSRLLWIKGDAGKGKTMLMIGIINELDRLVGASDTGLLSFFLCQGTDKDLNNATAVLRGLIYLLIIQQHCLISHLRAEYDGAGQRLLEGKTAFHTLCAIFRAMLNDSRLSEAYLVVDALDECDTDLNLLLELITQTVASPSSRVKWIVSSRNMPDIERQLDPDNAGVRLSLEVNAGLVNHAIDVFITDKLATLTSIRHDRALQVEVRDQMRQKANGTFLWVAFVFKELQELDEIEYEDNSEVLKVLDQMPSDLPALYDRMMEQINRLKSTDPKHCRAVLSAATVAYRPLHLLELPVLAGIRGRLAEKGSLERIINKCGSFLTIRDDHVYLVHQSAKDYLTTISSTAIWPAGPGSIHFDMFSRSLSALSDILRRNVYDLDLCNPGCPIEEVKTPSPDPLASVEYSSLYWIDHLCQADDGGFELTMVLCDDGRVETFLREHLLHWIESLSLLGKLPDGLLSIRKLLNVVPSQPDLRINTILEDAEKFILKFRSIMEEAPLQVYGAALVFCPTATYIGSQFWKDRLPSIKAVSGTREIWDPCRQTLEGHSSRVSAVAFSPDAKTLASGSWDNTIRLWDAATGVHQQTLEGHNKPVKAVAFSPDGKTLASGSWDNTIQLWDAATGVHQQTLKGHNGRVIAVAFSPDAKTLASGSWDNTIRLWDAATGVHQQTLEGHNKPVKAVAFSPDGKTLMSASGNEIRLWDTATGVHQQTFEGGVAFSPDGKTLASVAKDEIQLWDPATGAYQRSLKGPNSIQGVAFSPDSKIIASVSNYNEIWLWDAATGVFQQELQGHSADVSAVAFSLDGKTLASASHDQTIRLWNTAISTSQQTLEKHSNTVVAVVFSPNRKTLASASYDATIRLWDAATGAFQQTLRGHKDWVRAVAFSPDGQMLLSGSRDKTVRLWNSATGACQKILEGHKDWVMAVAFSPDGQMLLSGSYDKTVRLWNATTGACKQTFRGHEDSVTVVAFSPDGQMLLSGSHDKTVRLWNSATGTHVQTLDIGYKAFSLSFLEDGRYLRTKRGSHKISSDGNFSNISPTQKLSETGFFVSEEDWITRDGTKLLWLPPDFRSECVASHNGMLVLGHDSGQVTFLQFADE